MRMKRLPWKKLAACFTAFSALCLLFNFVGCGLRLDPYPIVSTKPVSSLNSNEISVADLPLEGRTTLQLIKSGGPFPYSQDSSVFNNYEGLLPKKPSGYYREYTVVTPGSSDRGARRIVAGEGYEYYYTADHYSSFKLIRE
jgi:ribonuclease T1